MANRRTAPTIQVGAAALDIGGAIVRRHFTLGDKTMRPGMVLTAPEVERIPRGNFNSLRDNGYLQPFPHEVRTHLETASPEPVEYHISNRGFGLYDVIEGKKVNARPLSKREAEDLASHKNKNTTAQPPKVDAPQDSTPAS